MLMLEFVESENETKPVLCLFTSNIVNCTTIWSIILLAVIII